MAVGGQSQASAALPPGKKPLTPYIRAGLDGYIFQQLSGHLEAIKINKVIIKIATSFYGQIEI
jgi:hypothetical protein